MKNTKIVNVSATMWADEAGYWRAVAVKGAAAGIRAIVGVQAGVKAGAGVALAGSAIIVRFHNAELSLLAHDGKFDGGRRGIIE